MKQSTYLDLTGEQIDAITDTVKRNHHNLLGKYKMMDDLLQMFKDEEAKLDTSIKVIEAHILCMAEGIITVELIKSTDRIKLRTTPAAQEVLADIRIAKDK